MRPCHALREAWVQGYGLGHFRRDILAGIVVGIVAVPLSMALAIASGVRPENGLYTAIFAGGVIAILGGSRVQVSGPTAAFVVILAPISAKFGLGGLMIATFLAGILLMAMGLMRFGTLIQFIPYPVVTGFTAGIAVVIGTLQLKDLLGLSIPEMPEHYVEKVAALWEARHTVSWPDLATGLGTLGLLLVWPRITSRVPAPLVALTLAALAVIGARQIWPDFQVATVSSRFSYMVDGRTHAGIPQVLPTAHWLWDFTKWPWTFPGADGATAVLDWSTIRALLVAGFTIAMLGAIESLLSAVVADGMTSYQHDPNAELFAQGVGNMVAPVMGGIAATGAIARTATNIRAGGRSPVASVTHAIFVLAAVLVLAPVLGALPMASLAALLLIVARNMAEIKHFSYVIRVGPRSDVAVLLTCFLLTVLFDMVIAVSVGVVLAAILFMRRMSDVADVKLIGDHHPELAEPLPPGTLVYEIAGPLFFGAAQKAMSALHNLRQNVKVVILDMESVPTMDATGLVNLQSTIRRLHKDRISIILGGVQPQPMRILRNAELEQLDSRIGICATFEEAVTMARFHAALGEDLHHAASPAQD